MLVALVASSVAANAQTSWNDPGSGSWFTTGNWTPSAVPDSTTAVIVDEGDAQVTSGAAASSTALLGSASGGNGTVTVDGSASSWTLSGNGQDFTQPSGGVLDVGQAGQGTLIVQNGGAVNLIGQSATVSIGTLAGSIGVVDVGSATSPSGSTSALSNNGPNVTSGNAGELYVGSSGTGTLNIYSDGSVNGFYDVVVGGAAGSNGTLNVQGGTLTFSIATANAVIGSAGSGVMTISDGGSVTDGTGMIASTSGSAGNVTVTGANSLWDTTGYLYVGRLAVGSLTVADGGTVEAGSHLIVGDIGSTTTPGTSTVTVNDGTLTAGLTDIGQAGAGEITIENGGKVTSDSANVGTSASGSATVTGAGSNWDTGSADSSSSLIVGYYGGAGTLNIGDGASVKSYNTYLNMGSAASSISVDGTGSSLSAVKSVYVGTYGVGTLAITNGGAVEDVVGAIGYVSTGTATVDGAGSSWTNTGNMYIGEDSGGTGTLNLQNGGTVSGATLFIGDNAGSTGTLNIGSTGTPSTGGTLSVSEIAFGGGTGTINFNQTDTFTVGAPITGAGSINQVGAGTTVLAQASNYTGTTTIAAGEMVAGNSAAFGGSHVELSGGTLAVGNGNRTITLANGYSQTNGTLLLSIDNAGSDRVDVAGGSTSLGGTLAVNFGGLTAGLGSPAKTSKYVVVATNSALGSTFANFDPTNVASGVSANVDYATDPDDVMVDVSQTAGLFPTEGLTLNQRAVANSINGALTDGMGSPLFTALGAAATDNPGAEGTYLDQLTPLDFSNFTSSVAFNNASFFVEQFDNYLANHRGNDGAFVSSGGIDTSSLKMINPDDLGGTLLALNSTPSAGPLSDASDASAGGVYAKSAEMKRPAITTSRWSAFVSGGAILAQGFSNASAGLSHSDEITRTMQFGADYQLSPNFIVGALLDYGHTDADLDSLGSSVSVDSYAPALYAAYSRGGWHADALGSYGFNKYAQGRRVDIGGFGGTASSTPSGDQIVGNLDGGYDFRRDKWTFGLISGLQYVHLDVGGYNEMGLSSGDLTVDGTQADSLRSRFGGRIAYAMRRNGTTFVPYVSASWQHEFLDQSRGVTSQFDGIGAGSFTVETANPSADSALLDVGLNTGINPTMTAFAYYAAQAGQDDYFGQAVLAGVAVAF
jgi:T5SS/PEP-CTERM-associated repeat protein